MIRCLIRVNGETVQQDDLKPGDYVAGRSRSAEIRLTEPDVSGKHLMLNVLPDRISAENLSSHGTLRNGSPLAGCEDLADGDVLLLGKNTEMTFEIRENVSPAEADDSATVVPSAAVPEEDRDRTQIPGTAASASVPEEDRDRTQIPGTENAETAKPETVSPKEDVAPEENVQKTDVMHTRLASLEEMNILRTSDRKRSTGKTLKYILGIICAVVLLAVLYSLRPAPREANLTWPVDAQGHQLGAFADPGGGGHKNGSFSLTYPDIKGKTMLEKNAAGIFITTFCGRDASVPLRIIFMEKQSASFLSADRRAVFSGMLAELQENSTRWNLAQISEVFFIGSENGLPCLSCEYRREADGESWSGEILFFRTGDKAYMRLAETPVAERARAQNFISNTPFLKFSPEYLQEHWEGCGGLKDAGDPAQMLDEVSRHLSKQAPFEWARTYLLLQTALMESRRTKDAALEKNALAQLRRLRTMQSVWYNSQKIQYNTAKLYQDRRQENAILELCKTVFSSPDDLRYFTLRRNVWE